MDPNYCPCCGALIYDEPCAECVDCVASCHAHDDNYDGPAETDDWDGPIAENH